MDTVHECIWIPKPEEPILKGHFTANNSLLLRRRRREEDIVQSQFPHLLLLMFISSLNFSARTLNRSLVRRIAATQLDQIAITLQKLDVKIREIDGFWNFYYQAHAMTGNGIM